MDQFDNVKFEELAEQAHTNYKKNSYYSYEPNIKFTNPNINTGYFAVMKEIHEGNGDSRMSIVKAIHSDIKFHRGWYSAVFQRLNRAELIKYCKKNKWYELTQLGQEYYNEVMKVYNNLNKNKFIESIGINI